MAKSVVQKAVFALGVVELALSCTLLLCGVTGFLHSSYLNRLGHGIWSGVFLIVAAVLAIKAGQNESTALHVAHMVFAILACTIILPVSSAVFGIEVNNDSRRNYWSHFNNGHGYGNNFNGSNLKAVWGEIAAIILSMVLFVIFILSACFTCCAVCKCCKAKKNDSMVYPFPTENVVILYTAPNPNCQYPMPEGAVGSMFCSPALLEQNGYRSIGFVMPPAYSQFQSTAEPTNNPYCVEKPRTNPDHVY